MAEPRFEVYPAIDLRDGRVVRLERGDFDRETSYSDDPAAQARAFLADGARWVHVVDLDAARTGEPGVNRSAIASICATGARIQCGGGVRSDGAAASLFDVGVDRVVVGTAAVDDPELLRRLVDRWPGRVVVGLDVRGDRVATHGWTADRSDGVVDVIRRLPASGVAALAVTQISVDGTLRGPDVAGLAGVVGESPVPVLASGGVGRLDDIRGLAGLEVAGRRLAGVIVGRALYGGRFTLAQAQAVAGG